MSDEAHPHDGTIRIGTSGWDYADWRGRFYPIDLPRRRWFEHYAAAFDTVELNATFYRLPDERTVARWAAQAPPGFTYAAKLGSFGTHRKKLRDVESWLPRHLERMAGLGGSAGPTLVQLPPHWHRNLDRLDALLLLVPSGQRWAVEVRDPSWVHDDTFTLLAHHGVALCVHDLLPHHPWELTTDWTYVRFHGSDAARAPYHGGYGARALSRAAEAIGRWAAEGVDVHAYFNNDVGGHAVHDARTLARLVGVPLRGDVRPHPVDG